MTSRYGLDGLFTIVQCLLSPSVRRLWSLESEPDPAVALPLEPLRPARGVHVRLGVRQEGRRAGRHLHGPLHVRRLLRDAGGDDDADRGAGGSDDRCCQHCTR